MELSWCLSDVSLQVWAFALQAAGAQCAIVTGSSSTPGQIKVRRQEIRTACENLAGLKAELDVPVVEPVNPCNEDGGAAIFPLGAEGDPG